MILACTVALLLTPPALPAAPPTDGRMTFGTKSEAARAAVREALGILEGSPQMGMIPRSKELHALAQKAVDADTESAIAHYLLAVAFAAQSERDAAAVQVERATELAKAAPDGERRFIEASIVRAPRSTFPAPWETRLIDYPRDEAIARWGEFVAKYPKEILGFLTLAEMHAGRYSALRSAPETRALDLEQAQKALRSALELDPTSVRAHKALGAVLVGLREFAQARREYETPPTLSDAVTYTYLLEGNRAEARARVRHQLERNAPTAVASWNFFAHLQLEAGDAAAGLAAYDQGLEALKKTDWSDEEKQVWVGRWHHGRGRSLARLGKHDEAWAEVEIVKKMIDAGGDAGQQYLPAWHYLAGYVKLEAGQAEAALDHLKQAGGQHDPHRTLLLGRACEALKDLDGARTHYRAVLDSTRQGIELAVSYDEAKTRLAALLTP